MAIQMRRGQRKDFQPTKLLPGEWAVSIDAATDNQIVWMCFAPGVTKRMGTYEDFKKQIEEATAEILDEYRTQLNIILAEVQQLAQQVRDDKNAVVIIKTQIETVYIPQMQQLLLDAAAEVEKAKQEVAKAKEEVAKAEAEVEKAAGHAADAKTSADASAASASESEDFSKMSESHNHGGTGVREGEDTDNSRFWSEQSKNFRDETEQAGIDAVGNIGDAKQDALDSIDQAEQDALDTINNALDEAEPEFFLDVETGDLYFQGGAFDFIMDIYGDLFWGVLS